MMIVFRSESVDAEKGSHDRDAVDGKKCFHRNQRGEIAAGFVGCCFDDSGFTSRLAEWRLNLTWKVYR